MFKWLAGKVAPYINAHITVDVDKVVQNENLAEIVTTALHSKLAESTPAKVYELINLNDVAEKLDVSEVARIVVEEFGLDAEAIAEHIDATDIAIHISAEDIANEIDLSDLASNIDTDDVGRKVAENFDARDIASEMDVSDVASNIDLTCLAAEVAGAIDVADIASNVEIDYEKLAKALLSQIAKQAV